MLNLILLAIYLIFLLIGYGIVYPELAGKPTYTRVMRSCFYIMAWSIVLTLYVLFATRSGIADATELSVKLGDFGIVMSMLLGAVALVGAFGLWAAHKIWPQPEESSSEDGGGGV